MSLIALALAALLAQADAGADAAPPTRAQLEARHLSAVQQLALLRTRRAAAKDRPALEREIAALAAEVDAMPAQIEAARRAEAGASTRALREKFEAADALAAARSADPAFAVPALSAAICNARSLRADAQETIRKERLYAKKGGGVVSLTRIHDAQDLMREADERERLARGGLKAFKRPAQPCKGKILVIAECVEDKQADGCADVADYLAAYEGLSR